MIAQKSSDLTKSNETSYFSHSEARFLGKNILMFSKGTQMTVASRDLNFLIDQTRKSFSSLY